MLFWQDQEENLHVFANRFYVNDHSLEKRKKPVVNPQQQLSAKNFRFPHGLTLANIFQKNKKIES